jgi:hypothetical protein
MMAILKKVFNINVYKRHDFVDLMLVCVKVNFNYQHLAHLVFFVFYILFKFLSQTKNIGKLKIFGLTKCILYILNAYGYRL